MTITTFDQLVDSLANRTSRVIFDKANLANQTAGRFWSTWRATGFPAQGAIPTAAALCDHTTAGAVGFAQQTAPDTSYLGGISLAASNSGTTVEIHDRLAHMGGLSLTVTTAQTVNLDLQTLAPPAARVGEADWSDLQWWLEVYGDGGATASNATINVTYGDGSSGNLNTQAVGGTIRIGNLFPLRALIPVADQAKSIRAVNNVTNSASTGTAGNFGFTVTRPRGYLSLPTANLAEKFDWADLELSSVPNGSCLFLIGVSGSTSTGTLRGGGKIIHG